MEEEWDKEWMASDPFHPAPIDRDMPFFLVFFRTFIWVNGNFVPGTGSRQKRVKTGLVALLVKPTRQVFARP